MSRADALQAFRCPDHGCDLVEWTEPDGDETGVWTVVHFFCPKGGEAYPGVSNHAGGYYPIDRDGAP